MASVFKQKRFICLFFIFLFIMASCSEPETRIQDDFILKTDDTTVSISDFNDELDLKRAAYPYDIKETPEEYNQMVIHLVKTLTEETILLSAAKESGIVVTDDQLEQAVADFKKDYPEDSFEQILLKNAISYPFWRYRFKKQMIMDRLINQELKKKIQITPEDIVEFYQQHQALDKTSAMDKIGSEKELVSRLRRHKTQEKYEQWIQALGEKFLVQINEKELKKILIESKEARNEN